VGSIVRKRILVFLLLFLILGPPRAVSAQDLPTETPSPAATADELILMTNLARTANGLQALTVNSIIMASAQWTAETMAASQMGGHLGGVRDRLMAAGYGGGQEAWATENVMSGDGLTAEGIVFFGWSDDTHSIPVKNPIYCDVGAGVARGSDGTVYYVLQAAYHNKRTCGPYIAPDGSLLPWAYTATAFYANPTVPGQTQVAVNMPPWIMPVKTVTPDAEGKLVHKVQMGQSLWSIAIGYGIKILDIQRLNGMPSDWETVYAGQDLVIPTSLTPYATQTVTPAPLVTTTPGQIGLVSGPVENATPSPPALQTPVTHMPADTDTVISLAIGGVGLIGLALIVFGMVTSRRRAAY
jgi:LysM repeat protein